MPATAPSPKKKAAPAKGGAKKPASPKPAKKSNIIPNIWQGKVTISPDFFEPHERPENWPAGEWNTC